MYSFVKWFGITCKASVCCWNTWQLCHSWRRRILPEASWRDVELWRSWFASRLMYEGWDDHHSSCDKIGARQDFCMMDKRTNILSLLWENFLYMDHQSQMITIHWKSVVHTLHYTFATFQPFFPSTWTQPK